MRTTWTRLVGSGVFATALLLGVTNTAGAATSDPLAFSSVLAGDGSVTLMIDLSGLNAATPLNVVVLDDQGNTIANDTITTSSDVVSGLLVGTYAVTVSNDTLTATDDVVVGDDGSVTTTPIAPYSLNPGGITVVSNGDGTDSVTVNFGDGLTTSDSFAVTLLGDNGSYLAEQTVDASATSASFVVSSNQTYVASITTTNENGVTTTTTLTSSDVVVAPVALGGVTASDNGDGTSTVVVTFDGTVTDPFHYDVTLTGPDGATLAQRTVDATVDSTTFVVPTVSRYLATVVTTLADGSVTTTDYGTPFPVEGGGTPVVVDPSLVTVTANDQGGWLVSWSEPDVGGHVGYYTVTDGDYSCVTAAQGTTGASDSCVLDDPSTSAPTVTVTYQPYLIMYDRAGGVSPTAFADGSVTTTTVQSHVQHLPSTTRGRALSGHGAPARSNLALVVSLSVLAGGLVVASGATTIRRRRRA